ncbi:hypothetical protein ACGH2B_15150 [Streptomyces sp. BBFR2]|uniref:hypothetical protein n=1 Tax=Streptomyces sp. BBFR2 TaxID=3372854 RepID=UPI0037DA4CBA
MTDRMRRTRFAASALVGCVSLLALATSPAAASAEGCAGNPGSTDGSGSVCLNVKGTKLKVNKFTLDKQSNNRAWKDKPVITAGKWKWTGKTVSARRVENKKVSKTINKSFPNNTRMCGYWSKYPGTKACITIHK